VTPPSSPEAPRRLGLPDPTARWALAAAVITWIGVAAGMAGGGRVVGAAVAAGVAAAILRTRWSTVALAAALALGATAGWSHDRSVEAVLDTAIEPGPARLVVGASTDPATEQHGDWMLATPQQRWSEERWVTWTAPPLLVSADQLPELAVGETALVGGEVVGGPGMARGQAYAARVRAHQVERLAAAGNPLLRAGNAVRERVSARLAAFDDPSAALLAGFLIGDTTRLPDSDEEALRRAGLSHFVAVSGSNVALFMAVWWVVVAPLSFGVGTRVVTGVLGLALFVTVTRWEPSVMRAAGMAAVMLVGRAVGFAISGWTALGLAVAAALLVSPVLSADLGFQLSVAATVGILIGTGMFSGVRPRWVATALGVTVAAQVAVTPILLGAVGSVPLASPVTNLIAAPLVAGATVLGGAGVVAGVQPLLHMGMTARAATTLPQLDPSGAAAAGMLALLAIRRSWRPLVAVAGATALVVAVGVPARQPDPPAAVFLDVGQGDATLLVGEEGGVVLIDGGPDPGVIMGRLAEHGIRRIDLVVLSHPHDDHGAGLVAVLARLPVGELWHPGFPDGGATFDELVDTADERRVEVSVPAVGHEIDVGGVGLEVLGPLRRYASPNDHSLVVRARLGTLDLLLSGDVEMTAQRELGPIEADVLKVAHHGAATSDLDWLEGSDASLAVISVGPNDFGHPSPDVVAALEASGARVARTDRDGDVIVRPP
jgi:competence protein ComEC